MNLRVMITLTVEERRALERSWLDDGELLTQADADAWAEDQVREALAATVKWAKNYKPAHFPCSNCGRPFNWENACDEADHGFRWIPCECGQKVPTVETQFGYTPGGDEK